jgi:hypothetical protein
MYEYSEDNVWTEEGGSNRRMGKNPITSRGASYCRSLKEGDLIFLQYENQEKERFFDKIE